MQGFLLAAGFGTRLWPLSEVRAKPAFPYRGVPLIQHTAALMRRHGVGTLWANTHHLPESIRAAADPDVHLVHEKDILGTAGAFVNLREELRHDRTVVMNAKVVTDIDLSAVIAQARGPVTMVCVPNPTREKFTHVDFASDGRLRGFVNDLTHVQTPYVFTGIQVLAPAFFDYLPPPGFSDTIKDVYPKILAAGHHIHVVARDDHWAEFSTLARYRDLHTGGFVDPRATVAADADVHGAVVWEHATVGAGAKIAGCIVADHVRIPAGLHVENAAIIQADRVRDRKDARISGELLIVPIT